MSQAEHHTQDAELLDRVRDALECYAESYDTMARIGSDGKVDCTSVAYDIRKNMVDSVLAVLARRSIPQGEELPSLPEPYQSKIQKAFPAIGRKLFESERPAVEAFNRKYGQAETTPVASAGSGHRPKDHNIRQLVNDLRAIAEKFHNHGSLRDRISGAVGQFIDDHFKPEK